MCSYSETNRHVKSAGIRSLAIGLLVALTQVGCGASPTIETVFVQPECTAPVIVEPVGFDWADLADVPVSVKEDIDETLQTLIDEVLLRQAMLEGLCNQ